MLVSLEKQIGRYMRFRSANIASFQTRYKYEKSNIYKICYQKYDENLVGEWLPLH